MVITELEGVILGIVWSRQPCSSYVVLSRFSHSPSWRWSSSTGAIYPAIRRLRARGLLIARSASTGNRRSELLVLSDAGRSVLSDWICALTEDMGSAGPDPICMRVAYLGSIEPKARMAFIDRAEDVTRSRLDLARDYRGDPDASQNWAIEASARGLIKLLEARLEWLQEMRELLAREPPPGSAGRSSSSLSEVEHGGAKRESMN